MADVRPRRVTSIDVARESGVTAATVSYVLNNTAGKKISAPTRARVIEAARALGYVPNARAASLSAGRTTLTLLDVSTIPSGPGIESFIRGYSQELARFGLTTIVYSYDSRLAVSLEELARTTSPFVVTSLQALQPDTLAYLRQVGVAHVTDAESWNESSLKASVEWGGAAQIEHLVDMGHRQIAYALPAEASEFTDARWDGASRKAAELGLGPLQRVSIPEDQQNAAGVVERILAAQPVTAVACYHDETALAVLAALRTLSRVVPDDVSVIGYSDIPVSALASPPLTTIREDATLLGRSSAQSVLVRAELVSDESGDSPAWHPEVVVRQSVSAPSSVM